MTFSKLTLRTKLILSAQALGMLMGTSTHLIWVLNNGFLSEKYNAPFLSSLFWDSLTFLDPLAAILLFFKPKAGIYLTLIIIVVDVIHNNVFYMNELYINPPSINEWLIRYWMILGQILFAVFVLSTLNANLHSSKSAQ